MASTRYDALGALRRVSAQSLTLLLSRIELAGLELGEGGTRVVRRTMMVLACTALFQLAVLAASAALVWLLWERFGALTLTLLGLALAYGAIGIAILSRLRRDIDTAPPLLSRTVAELGRDRAALFGDAATATEGIGAVRRPQREANGDGT